MADESLRLRIEVDDQASAQLLKLKSAMQELSGGQNAAAMDRMARQAQELGRHLRPIAEEAGRTTSAMRLLSRELTAVASVVAGAFALDKFKQLAEQMIALDRLSKQTGISVGQIKGAIDQLEQTGMSRGAAAANIQGIANALANLSNVSSELRQKMMLQARTDPQAMAAFLQRLTGFANAGDLRGAVNEIMNAYNNVVENAIKQGKNRIQAATQGAKFLEDLGMTKEMLDAAQASLQNLSDAQVKAIERQIAVAKQFNTEWVKTSQFVGDVVTGIQGALLPAMVDFNKSINASGEAWGESIGKAIEHSVERIGVVIQMWKDVGKAIAEPFTGGQAVPGAPAAPPGFWEKLNPFNPANVARERAATGQGRVGGIPPIGDLLGGGQLAPGARGNMAQPLLSGGTGWRGMPMSTNIEDRRGEEEQTNWLRANTEELKRLNDALTGAAAGGAPGGALGFLGTQAGGLAAGLGGGTGTASLGGPMGGLGGMGGGGGGRAPYGNDSGPGTGAGAGATPATGGTQQQPSIGTPFGPPAGKFTPTPQAGGGGDLSRTAYDKMFAGTPLAGQYDTVVAEAQKNNVPPSLMASIMGFETGRGTSAMLRNRLNPAGLMDPKTGMRQGQSFATIQEGIAAAGRTIGNRYREAGGDIQQMAKAYAPVGARNDPNRTNAQWPGSVARLQEQLSSGGIAAAAPNLTTLATRAGGGGDLSGMLSPTPTALPGASTPGVDQGIAGPAALQIARQHLGEDEIRDEAKLSSWFRTQGIKISPRTTAWCAAFVNSSLAQAGIKGTGSLAAASFYKYGTHVDPKNVQPGDIAVWPHHVAFTTGEQAKGRFEVLGGNQGGTISGRGGVSTSMRAFRGAEIRRPPAAAADGQTAISMLRTRPSSGDALDSGILAGRELDKTPSVNVNGSGKISVEVKAPAGTKASANGDGLFKKTEIARQTQMEPAKSSTSSDQLGAAMGE